MSIIKHEIISVKPIIGPFLNSEIPPPNHTKYSFKVRRTKKSFLCDFSRVIVFQLDMENSYDPVDELQKGTLYYSGL